MVDVFKCATESAPMSSHSHHLMNYQDPYRTDQDTINYPISKQFPEDVDILSGFVLPNIEIMIPVAPFMVLPTSFRCSMEKNELGKHLYLL